MASDDLVMADHDPVMAYASGVLEDRIPANQAIRKSAKRCLEEIGNPPSGFQYDPSRWHAIATWCKAHLKVITNQRAVPFEFLPWQAYFLGQAESWYRVDENGEDIGSRFKVLAGEASRGSGKTCACIAVCVWKLMHQDYQQILVTAQGIQQLRDVWIHQLTAMVNESPMLADAIKVSSSMSMNARAKCDRTHGVITFRATTGKSLQGGTYSAAYCDELSQTVQGDWLEAVEQGISKDSRAMLVSITTPPPAELQAGPYAIRRLAWSKAYEEGRPDVLFLPWGIDIDDPIEGGSTDEEQRAVYEKAFPPGFSSGMKTLKDYQERLELDRQQDTLANFELRQCCRFTTSGGSWLPAEWVERAQLEIGLEAVRGRDCWAGLDMSKSGDLTSLCAIFDVDGQKVAFSWHFVPDIGARTKFHVYGPNIEGWRELAHVHVSDGPLIDMDSVHGRLHWLNSHANLRIVKYDDWAGPGDERIRAMLTDDSLPWNEQPQVGRDWSGATSQLKAWFACDENHDPVLRIAPDPLMVFSAGLARTVEDTNGNIRLTKKAPGATSSTGTIDPLIACVLAICGIAEESSTRSIFEKGPISLA